MKIDKQLKKTVTGLVELSFRDGKAIESQVIKSIRVLKLLPQNKAIQALSEYLQGIKRLDRQHTMYIETVIPLSVLQIKKMKKIIEKKVKITKVVAQINPEILGGFKLKAGDEIWDESVLGRIGQVREAIRG